MINQKDRYYKIMFTSAAIFNWCAATLWLIDFEGMFQFMGGGDVPQSPVFNLILQCLSMIIIVFGGVYYSIGQNPRSPTSQAFAIVGSIGKFFLALIFYYYAIQGDIPLALAGVVTGDFIYTILFIEYLVYQKKANQPLAF